MKEKGKKELYILNFKLELIIILKYKLDKYIIKINLQFYFILNIKIF